MHSPQQRNQLLNVGNSMKIVLVLFALISGQTKTYLVHLKDLHVDASPNRITAKGVKAFSVKAEQNKQHEIAMSVI